MRNDTMVKKVMRSVNLYFKDNFELESATVNSLTKTVKFKCKAHGFFRRSISGFVRGVGCPKCNPIGREKFIEIMKNKFGDMFDYDKTEFKNLQVPVKMFCKKHGEQSALGYKWCIGVGCKECKGFTKKNTVKKSLPADC